jgi:hypothetical protein
MANVTVIIEVKNEVSEADEQKYTEEQLEIIALIYAKAKEIAETIVQMDIPSAMKVSKMIAEMIKLLEGVTIHNKKISGKTKKHIAITLSRNLICKTADESSKDKILGAFDDIADQMLETLIDVSRNVNVQEIASSCCKDLTTSCCASMLSSLRS